MSETQKVILNTLKMVSLGDEILRFCVQPRSTAELKNYLVRKYSIAPNFADTLERLEASGALTYKDNTWITTPQAKAVLDKYFG